MRFCIRDDDISAFTCPEDMEEVWGQLALQVTLAVIPCSVAKRPLAIKGREYLLHELGAQEHPISRNTDLLHYIARNRDRYSLALHGCSHRYRLAAQRLVAEYAVDDVDLLRAKTRRAVDEFRTAFGETPDIFIPPDNALSPACWNVLARAGFRFVQFPLPAGFGAARWVRSGEMALFWWRRFMARILTGNVFTGVTRRDGIVIGAAVLMKIGQRQRIESQLRYCRERDLPVTLATHYWEMQQRDYRQFFMEVVQGLLADGAELATMRQLYLQ